MDIKRLRTFVTVADLGTVSKAALHLRISQSALSRQIADFEYECGFRLFDRIGRRLFLTTRGLRSGQGRGAAADHRKRAREIPAALCRTLPQRAGETD